MIDGVKPTRPIDPIKKDRTGRRAAGALLSAAVDASTPEDAVSFAKWIIELCHVAARSHVDARPGFPALPPRVSLARPDLLRRSMSSASIAPLVGSAAARLGAPPRSPRTAASARRASRARLSVVAAAEGGGKTVVFVGGTGRVGSSSAAALLASDPSVGSVVLAGRSRDAFSACTARHPALANGAATFAEVDVAAASSAAASLAEILTGADLVVHSAGPFQGGGDGCAVLDAAIAAKVPYLDVCDDAEYAKAAKSRADAALGAAVPCVTTAGIYPGVSNIMAADMIAANIAASESDDDADSPVGVEYVLYSYFARAAAASATPSSPPATCSAASPWSAGRTTRGWSRGPRRSARWWTSGGSAASGRCFCTTFPRRTARGRRSGRRRRRLGSAPRPARGTSRWCSWRASLRAAS